MKAWRFYGFGDMRLDDVPAPTKTRTTEGHDEFNEYCHHGGTEHSKARNDDGEC